MIIDVLLSINEEFLEFVWWIKNSLFFCGDKGARNSSIYNTFISTFRQVGVSFRDYFRKLMKELGTGRTDYENLLPMTIGI